MYKHCFVLMSVVVLGTAHQPLDVGVAGGSPINITQAPYQVAILSQSELQCSGTILNKEWIVSAAHCVLKYNVRLPLAHLTVRAGSNRYNSGGSVHSVIQTLPHPKYSVVTWIYDVSLIKVSPPFNFTAAVQPLGLSAVEPVGGESSFLTGWGQTNETDRTPSETIQAVNVSIISRQECAAYYSNNQSYVKITEQLICTGVPEGGKGACKGDSGGSLVINDTLTGIVFWSVGCALPDRPNIYVNVPAVRFWIEANTVDDDELGWKYLVRNYFLEIAEHWSTRNIPAKENCS